MTSPSERPLLWSVFEGFRGAAVDTRLDRLQKTAGLRSAPTGRVMAVSRDGDHNFTKPNVTAITLLAGLGVQGDAHLGETVQHLVRVREDPTKPNLRQVH